MLAPALSQLAWAHAHETLIWASKDKRSRHTFNYDLINSPDPDAQVSSVWRIPTVPRREKLHGRHPTQKPLRLLRRAILASTGEGELIFDPFSGSGTTGVASKELGRFFVGTEMEREFAELAACRIGATERGSCWGRSGPSAAGVSELVRARGITVDQARSAAFGPKGRGARGVPHHDQRPSSQPRKRYRKGGRTPSIVRADRLARAPGTALSAMLVEVERSSSSSGSPRESD